jgi:uncharacterized RDD family membrane protein YckC
MSSSFDNLIIETPEQTSLEFPLAGVGSRFLAIAADLAIQFVAAFILVLIAVFALPAINFTRLGPQWFLAGVGILIYVLNSGYFALFEAIWNGQTPGKRYAQIRVIKDDGRPISAYDSIARNFLRVVDEMPSFYIIGVLSIFLSKQNKRLGDYVAGTVVVHEKTIQDARPFLETKTDNSWPMFDTSQITVDELRVIETFLHRRDSFEPSLRTGMAAKITRRIAPKLGVEVIGWPQTERFLEAVYEQYRSAGRYQS